MKAWWTDKALPWLKANWWKIFLPFIIVGGVLAEIFKNKGPAVVVVDPTAAADERARIEAETRSKVEEAERQRLARELTTIDESAKKDQQSFEQQQASQVDALRQDSEKLRQEMLDAGKGRS